MLILATQTHYSPFLYNRRNDGNFSNRSILPHIKTTTLWHSWSIDAHLCLLDPGLLDSKRHAYASQLSGQRNTRLSVFSFKASLVLTLSTPTGWKAEWTVPNLKSSYRPIAPQSDSLILPHVKQNTISLCDWFCNISADIF